MIKNYVSIIFSHYAQNEFRSELMQQSLRSLISTTVNMPCEIIVYDNGQSLEDSSYLLFLCQTKKIHVYMRYSDPMFVAIPTNTAVFSAMGEYVVLMSNDILLQDGWLEKCISYLDATKGEKFFSSPLDFPRGHKKYFHGNRMIAGDNCKLDLRAGSNCLVLRKTDFLVIGGYFNSGKTGSKWFDESVRKGYMTIVTPQNMAVDAGFRKGWNYKPPVEIKRTLTNGQTVYFNTDRFKYDHPELTFYE